MRCSNKGQNLKLCAIKFFLKIRLPYAFHRSYFHHCRTRLPRRVVSPPPLLPPHPSPHSPDVLRWTSPELRARGAGKVPRWSKRVPPCAAGRASPALSLSCRLCDGRRARRALHRAGRAEVPRRHRHGRHLARKAAPQQYFGPPQEHRRREGGQAHSDRRRSREGAQGVRSVTQETPLLCRLCYRRRAGGKPRR
ncbi:unnamed protein product [Chondrus crispus]|uniref:Uncharacterized protein n=1 Tax=Chondrus crispus TaxID=2769 RepID=R7QQ51_CHOCR|nr:unnamed protein product [Chondrus crispus]CDF39606.1 unnamed protein product [Chondrus crispus]|eukprot:XP_005709900.1 unnamed protein product [Chondrus crispus]